MKNLIISGYGKMGKEIEKVAVERGWNICAVIDNDYQWQQKENDIKKGDVIIDFSMPAVALKNIERAFALNIPLVMGTTGWYNSIEKVKTECIEKKTAFVWASNFSIGVNIFFEINKALAGLMNNHENYNVEIEEIHHTAKLDSPSGTAITLANQIIENLDRKSEYVNRPEKRNSELAIISKRIADVPGTHLIKYISSIDEIEIKHTAKSRRGFAEGAVWAAEWITGKKGFYNFSDILFNKL